MKNIQNIDGSVSEILIRQFTGWHISRIPAGKQLAGALLRFFRLFLAVNQFCQLVSQDFLLPDLTGFLPLIHLIDLLNRQEGQHAETF